MVKFNKNLIPVGILISVGLLTGLAVAFLVYGKFFKLSTKVENIKIIGELKGVN